MRYFNGFGLEHKFDNHIESLINNFGFNTNQYDIVGFDSGAKFALDYAFDRITNGYRVGKIILVSPLSPHLCFSDNKVDIFTHLDYAAFICKYGFNCWELFSEICKQNFYKNTYLYAKKVVEKYNFNNQEKVIINNICHERVFWLDYLDKFLYKSNNLDFISRNSKLFVVFIAENDRILNSKEVLSFFSKFGICLFIKGVGRSFL